MMKKTSRVVAICSLLFLMSSVASAQQSSPNQWTRFRGPNGAGQSEDKGIPDSWTEKDYNWQTKLPGIGHSSPVLWGKKIFLLSADPETATRYVICINAVDGEPLWQREFPSSTHHLHSRNSFASSTPALDKDHVYIAWSTPEETTLMALTHEGEDVWARDLGPFVSMHGFGTSPIVYNDLVVLPSQQQNIRLGDKKPGVSFIIAVDSKTGKTRWQTPRKSAVAAYSVPCVYQAKGGTDELIFCSTAHGVVSLDPKTGKENWGIDTFTMRAVSSPIIAGGLIFGSTGSGGGGNYVVAIRPGKNPEEVFRIKKQAPYVPTPVAKDDLVFLWYDKGIVTCINATDGKIHWRERVGGEFSGSPVRVRDRIYCIDHDGQVVVLAADKEYRLLGKSPLGEYSRTTPAVADGYMYLRSESQLFCIGSGKP